MEKVNLIYLLAPMKILRYFQHLTKQVLICQKAERTQWIYHLEQKQTDGISLMYSLRAVNPSGQFQTRVFSIPVQVGAKVPEKPHPGLKTLKDGTKVIEMKAAEEVIFD